MILVGFLFYKYKCILVSSKRGRMLFSLIGNSFFLIFKDDQKEYDSDTSDHTTLPPMSTFITTKFRTDLNKVIQLN